MRHLDDQCIGCQYCVLKCPYDVPKYSERLGIVRKCDMCTGRLAAGEAPACVQACPHEAITIELIDRAAIVERAVPGTEMVPGAFDSHYTKPTTRFHSAKMLPDHLEAGDEAALRLEHAHWPLVWMLLFTQMSAGLFVALGVSQCVGSSAAELRAVGLVGWVALQIGLAVSILHLGRPLGAWRFFLGLRTSWMSREILAFSAFAGLASATVAALWLPVLPVPASLERLRPLISIAISLTPWLTAATAATGLAGVFTSVMIYVDTRRPYWAALLTAPKFYGATVLLGAATAAFLLACFGERKAALVALGVAFAIRLGQIAWEKVVQRISGAAHVVALRRSQHTTQRHLPWVPEASDSLLVVFLISSVVAVVTPPAMAAVALAFMLASAFAASLLERFCFFTTCPAPRMPGGVSR